MSTIVTFTNLYPSTVMPQHGLFVRERMRRVAAHSGLDWCVVAPVPDVIWPLRTAVYRRWHAVPQCERDGEVEVLHPRYRHWPGISLRRQADAMADGARAAVAAIAARGPIVIDAHYVWPDGVAAAKLAGELGVPFTITARGTDLNLVADDAVVARRIAAAAPRAFGLFAVSGALAHRFGAVVGLPPERITEVRNGVDLERFAPGDPGAARRRLGLPASGRLLLGVGRLISAKGFLSAVRALAVLPDDVRLVLVGDGPERGAIAALGGDRVVLLGSRPPAEVADCYRACDLFVLPSWREGWPNVVSEALASGLRVVTTDVGGIPEILGLPGPGPRRVEGLGTLVTPGDDQGLATAIAELLATPAEPTRVRAYAERWGWEEPVALLTKTFRDALAEVAV